MSSLKKSVIFFFLLIAVLPALAQRYNHPAEKNNITAKKDTAQVKILNGLSFSLRESDPDLALQYSSQAYQLSRTLSYKKGMGRAMGNSGWIYYRKGDFVKALEDSYEGLKLSEREKDLEEVARSLNNIGAINYEQKQYESALVYFKRAAEISRQINDLSSLSRSLNNIAYLYLSSSLSLDSAIVYSNRAHDISLKTKEAYLVAFSYRLKGDIYSSKKDYKQALENYEQSVKYCNLSGVNTMRVAAMHRIAKIYVQTGRNDEAIVILKKNINEAHLFGYRDELERSYKVIAQAYQAKANSSLAYDYLQKHLVLHDSLYNAQNTSELSSLRNRFDMDMKQAQIELLTKESALHQEEITRQRVQLYALIGGGTLFLLLMIILLLSNQKIKRAKSKLEHQKEELAKKNEEIGEKSNELIRINATKDKLFSIIGHDFRSPLQSLKGLLELIKYKNLSQQEFAEYSKDLRKKVDNVYNNLNNLLNWSVLQLQGIQTKPAPFEIHELAEEVCDLYIQVSEQKNVLLLNEMEDNVHVLADRDQIHLVIRNLISNSIKFTPTGGTVKIYCQKTEGNHMEISVEDSGVGIAAKDMSKLFGNDSLWTINGTNNEKGLGLGLRLCKEFIEKNNGHLAVHSEPGIGTTFTFTLPLSVSVQKEKILEATSYLVPHSQMP